MDGLQLVSPGIGLMFWTTLIFLILLFLLGKFAWKPINKMINKRNQSIEDALNMAETARNEVKNLQASNDKIIAEARAERDVILKEARQIKEQIISQAKADAQAEIEKLKKIAKIEIETQKSSAMEDMKNLLLDLSLNIAQKVVRQQLSAENEHERLVNDLLNDVRIN